MRINAEREQKDKNVNSPKDKEAHIKKFRELLGDWYKNNQRNLPWRNTHDPYRIWISEIMLQQTTVPTVIPYFKRWMERFPAVESLATASLQEILTLWQGLGYYQRAKNLHKTALLITDSYGGSFPRTWNELIKLPGIGPYTASAILSFAFGLPYPALDANVRRLVSRLQALKNKSQSQTDKMIMDFLHPLFKEGDPGLLNQALMELGSLICRPRNPLCLVCPVSRACLAYASGIQELFPPPVKLSFKKIETVIGIFERNGLFLIQKRPSKGLMADLWEFPGGKREPDETLEQALRREIREELNCEISHIQPLITVKHAYTQFRVTLHAFRCRHKGRPRLIEGIHRWIAIQDFQLYPFPSGDAKIIRSLEKNP
ncbi:MAG: A/G-specific adenine glycosylase [Candidatus Aminicenantes bacterium]|nr:A/G-specific adenine glycosylase [Candidatus Aminicenantes bacterium]